MSRLDGKVALITGTGGGQGRAAAVAFAAAGASVVGCDLDERAAEVTVEEVRRSGGAMTSVAPLDIADSAAAMRLVQHAEECFGGVDIVYNNAGAMRWGSIEDYAIADWDFTLRNELTIVFALTKAAWPALRRRGGGVVLSTASISAYRSGRGDPGAFAHEAAKAGVIAFTRAMAGEGARYGIRAVSISPGFVRSPASEFLWADPDHPVGQAIRERILHGRPATCDEIAKVALFLASDDGAYINATDILVDGGSANIL